MRRVRKACLRTLPRKPLNGILKSTLWTLRMLNLNDLALFVTAVEQGGFAAGGRHLGLPRST
jgi:hypothetical protein